MNDNPFLSDVLQKNEHLCFSCGLPMRADARYCDKCNTPVGIMMGSDPLQAAHMEGLLYARAFEQKRPKLIVILCMWILIFPLALFFGAIALLCLINFTQMGFFGALVFLTTVTVSYLLFKKLIVMTWRFFKYKITRGPELQA
jgi:hypothetical protein